MTFKKFMAIIAMVSPTFLFAQKEITITDANKDMSLGNKSSFVLTIPEANSKDVNGHWIKLMKKEKGKPEANNLEIKVARVTIKDISVAPFNVYTSAVDVAGNVQFTAWFMEGDSSVIASDSTDEVSRIRRYLHDFGVQEYKSVAQDQLAAEQKKSKQLDGFYDGVVKDQKKADDAIANAQKQIAELQDKNAKEAAKVETAKANRANMSADVGAQQDLDAQNKTAKQLQVYISDQQKAEDNIKSNNARIARLQEKIKEETANSDKAKNLQGPARANADAQKTVVAAASDKLNNIK
jgi:hypothetical protein